MNLPGRLGERKDLLRLEDLALRDPNMTPGVARTHEATPHVQPAISDQHIQIQNKRKVNWDVRDNVDISESEIQSSSKFSRNTQDIVMSET